MIKKHIDRKLKSNPPKNSEEAIVQSQKFSSVYKRAIRAYSKKYIQPFTMPKSEKISIRL